MPSTGGQACIIAGRQIIAAELNSICTGACVPPPIAFALDGAKTIVQQYCVDLSCGSSSGLDSSVTNTTLIEARRQVLEFAELLTGYNTGLHGPGHCVSGSGLEAEVEEHVAEADDDDMDPGTGFWVVLFVVLGGLVVCIFGMLVCFAERKGYEALH